MSSALALSVRAIISALALGDIPLIGSNPICSNSFLILVRRGFLPSA